MQLVFNELSLNDNLEQQEGINHFHKFINTYSKAVSVGFSRALRTHMDFNAILLAENYYSFKWRNEEKDRDIIRRYQGLCDRQLVLYEENDECEVRVGQRSGKGILDAYLKNNYLISICGQKVFEQSILNGKFYSVLEEGIEDIEVCNISKTEDIEGNKEFWEKIRRLEYEENIDKGEFVRCLPTYYPSLVFGEVAVRQLLVEMEHQHFKTVRMKLLELEDVFSKWDGGRITTDMFQSKMTPESPETLKRFKDEHTFRFGDDNVMTASYHIRYTGNIPGRIYFYPNKADKKCYICSLTTKLPTVSDPKIKI